MTTILHDSYVTTDRSVVRRHEMMQKHLEKCEEIMSAKSDAKDALAKEVYRLILILYRSLVMQ